MLLIEPITLLIREEEGKKGGRRGWEEEHPLSRNPNEVSNLT